MNLVADRTARQGGDLRGLDPTADYLDLGTCVNRYGPPPAVGEALRQVDLNELRAHPYDAETMFTSAYADYLGVEADELVAGRGITEFIRLLAALLPKDRVAVITPDYTDSIRNFPNHLPGGHTPATRLARIEEAMRRYDYVLLSNPNNPLGIHIAPQDLAAVCRANPLATLIVDEAYIDFTAHGGQRSMVWAGVRNVIVMLSPNKLFGIAGTRTGVLWTPIVELRGALAARRLNWPISYLDALVASAALRATDWAATTRARLLETASELETLLLRRYPGVVTGVPVHYRFVATEAAQQVHDELVRAGVVVRVFSGHQPGRVSGLRITAPTEGEMARVRLALA
ncbi:MAG TPA: aminotransferase class I/II-fold pyridoxal phosphate-dependent enzyme [Pseudonocardiaceae bacterium]